MKSFHYVACLLAASLPLLCAADEPSMKFWARSQGPGPAKHEIDPYRIGNEMIVVVHDPIVCGQRPVAPRLSVQAQQVVVQYELTEAPAGEARACVAHSIFKIDDLPDRSLNVAFAGGAEPVSVVQLRRCPSQQPKTDPWDCLVPAR